MISERIHRRACRLHMLKRSGERGLSLTVLEMWRLERRIERCRAAFAKPLQRRYELTLVVGRDRIVVVYDAELRCLVTILSKSSAYRARRRYV